MKPIKNILPDALESINLQFERLEDVTRRIAAGAPPSAILLSGNESITANPSEEMLHTLMEKGMVVGTNARLVVDAENHFRKNVGDAAFAASRLIL